MHALIWLVVAAGIIIVAVIVRATYRAFRAKPLLDDGAEQPLPVSLPAYKPERGDLVTVLHCGSRRAGRVVRVGAKRAKVLIRAGWYKYPRIGDVTLFHSPRR